ncbi:MAG TPA: hypothetical protein VM011_07980 [Gammaproteobacteria bacterium]|nr:hypothetical protein [Gammaproteobacteria bacterium]
MSYSHANHKLAVCAATTKTIQYRLRALPCAGFAARAPALELNSGQDRPGDAMGQMTVLGMLLVGAAEPDDEIVLQAACDALEVRDRQLTGFRLMPL